MKAIWLTDVHLEFLDERAVSAFLRELSRWKADAVLISGDISQAPTVSEYLSKMAKFLEFLIYFVLGNHDFYHGSIPAVKDTIRTLSKDSPLLHWLTDRGPVCLGPTTCLVGHDGWGDARPGDYHSSILPNLATWTGPARYGRSAIQEIFEWT